MSQTPLDTSQTSEQTINKNAAHDAGAAASGANGANGAAPEQSGARRRHRRPAPRRREVTAEGATQGEPQAGEATAPVTQTPSQPAEPAGEIRASAPAVPAQATQAGQAPQPATRTAGGRRGTRRPARPRGPQLIRRDVAEGGETPAGEGAEPAETTVEADTITAELAREVDEDQREAVDASGVSAPATDESAPETFAANTETLRADVAGDLAASEEQPAPQPRRYRFDRRAPASPVAPALRPERITGAFAPPQSAAEPVAPAAPPADAIAQPVAQPVAEETANLLSLGAPVAPAGTVVPQAGEREALPAPASAETGAPPEDVASGEEVSSAFAGEPSDDIEDAGQGAEDVGGAPRKRRRRRRNGSAVRHLEAIGVTEPAEEEPTPLPRGIRQQETEPEEPIFGGYTSPPEPLAPGRGSASASAYTESGQPYQMYAPMQQDEPWNVASAYEQIRQPRSPFGAPEPNTPRGFGQQPQGVAAPYQERSIRSTRNDRQMDMPPISANQLGSIITQAIQQQTDRLLAEMRHTQAPPSMTVMFPPLPSTERVSVFVDVANLLYSSRNLRVAIDFGRLLEFLRGNRRLVRAHAYAPTSPEPHAEQQFLSVVKGVGYRITTKNYKTFSSGAKKADLDLDLCMDVVRMVDANAVDSVVLVSGDSDFLPLLEYCSDHGVRVEVAAFEDAASAILRQSCDLFINLSLVDDIRA